MTDTIEPTIDPGATEGGVGGELDAPLERRGRWWVFGSFVFCPCHLPLTLGLLTAVFGGTSAGVLVRSHAWLAGTILTVSWIAGTWYGFRLLRRARSGMACPVPTSRRWPVRPSRTR